MSTPLPTVLSMVLPPVLPADLPSDPRTGGSGDSPRGKGPGSSRREQPGRANVRVRKAQRQRPATAAAGLAPSEQAYVVFLDDAPGQGGVAERAAGLLRSLGAASAPTLVFNHLNGLVLRLTEVQAQRLRALGGVRSVEADAAVQLDPPLPGLPLAETRTGAGAPAALPTYSDATAGSGETLPWGVRAVWRGEDISLRGDAAADAIAFVIDSGVLAGTGDLNLAGASSWHRSWISGETPFNDGNGHGTHVAGTIAAQANGVGVVGVAPGAQVVSLKVFNSSGGGASYSSIIDAINHAVAVVQTNGLNKGRVVVNMSLTGGFSTSLDTAVKNAAAQGIRFAIAAGNDAQDADGYSPAAAGDHPNVYTASAVDSSYRMASFSNWDRLDGGDAVDDVDVAAPGVSVLSYYRNGQLARLDGTSMASPHVAGLLLMGGVQPGDPVTPQVSGTADPFALIPLTGGSDPQPEPTSDQVLWGTTASDTVTGGGGNDRISGVLASGTSATAMGALQIDVLTGSAGSDVFLLGDGRGVFYDDRKSGSLGTADYALIKDFTAGTDRVQLRNVSHLTTVSADGLSLYWDRNANGLLESGGRNRDELIAVVEGATALSSSDLVFV
jgi:subtilisin family serine protease